VSGAVIASRRALGGAAVSGLLAAFVALAGPAEIAQAADCRSVKVGKFKLKKIRKSDGIACGDARRIGKLWVKRDYDDFNPIHVGERRWFCSWRRRAPQSTTTGTAECDADPGEEVNFAVRKRR
jgi:hypothetical protein